jgi:hypothetical protein
VSSRWSYEQDEQGRPAMVLETNNNITERKLAERLTAMVFESTPDAIAIVGKDYRYRRVNPVYEQRCGIPAERIVGMHVSEILGADVFDSSGSLSLTPLIASTDAPICVRPDDAQIEVWGMDCIVATFLAATTTRLGILPARQSDDCFGWICDGPLGGSATKNRTFVWWVDLADSRLTASGHLHAGADVLVRRVKWQFDRAVDGPWLLWNVPDVRFRWLAPCDVGSALAWGVRRSLSYQTAQSRSDLKPARTSSAKSCGCSQAAKCPPLSSLL